MNADREKATSVMGLVVSVLLHGIFFAGCFALDAASTSLTAHDEVARQDTNQVNHDLVADQKAKS